MKLEIIIICLSIVVCVVTTEEHVAIKKDLQPFLGTLEKYTFTRNEVVFLLDESGSIGAERYLEVKIFTNLVLRRFSVTAEHTRVAIVPFATEPRTKVNYIIDSVGKNMCTLVKSVADLDYAGQETYTSLAMERARKILAHSRPNANKIIVLLSDGKSNGGYSPIAAANLLKQEGVIIFSVGVADANKVEMEAVATSKDHFYIMTDFDYIKQLNAFLMKASDDTSWDEAKDASLCDRCEGGRDCCDEHASCYCGTLGGNYECVCDAGYYGKTGLKRECYACPRGTFKSKESNLNCEKCPPHSTTKFEGSTSRTDCVCEIGHEKHGNECKPVECVKLQIPEGGVIIPSNCSNLYGSQCTLRCKEGYCPYSCNVANNENSKGNSFSLPSRTCLKSGNWSGDDFYCEKVRCPALEHLHFGNHNCSGSNFVFGTTCYFDCGTGYELTGSPLRTCLPDGTWTGTQTYCKKIECEMLKVNQNLRVKPKFCSTKKMHYGSVCKYSCTSGYSLTSQFGKFDGIKECLLNKTWSGADLQISCSDISPPVIDCPPSKEINNDPLKGTALLAWEKPTAHDNVFVEYTAIKYPEFLKKETFEFPIGTNKIVYEAVDSSNNSNTCSFFVTVIDNESPKVLFCPDDIEVYNEFNRPIQVNWTEPKFSDNSGTLNITSDRKSGDGFQWGPASVIYYNATDPYGNTASCSFKVKVKQYPCPLFEPPINGILTCDKWQDGRVCSVFCNEGYEFASQLPVPTTYECNPRGSSSSKQSKWLPFLYKRGTTKFEFPVPECSKKQKRNAVNETYEIKYPVEVCNEEIVELMKSKFINTLKPLNKKIPGLLCPVEKGCKPENVNVSCGLSYQKKRSKRSFDTSLKKMSTLLITFNIEVYPNVSKEISEPVSEIPSLISSTLLKSLEKPYLKEIKSILSQTVREVYNKTSILPPEVNYKISSICLVGQITLKNFCVDCPPGTFKDVRIESCVDCPQATFQEKKNTLACSPCPKGYTTYQKRSKSISDCTAPCQPGTYSRTTFEPCLPCPLNTYQENYMRKECLKCPHQLLTWRTGSNSSTDCASACEPGTYSSTGLQPCTLCDNGSYQSNFQQKSCEFCPSGTSTRQQGSTSQTHCKEIDLCEELHPCSNSSTCVPKENGFICLCKYGSIGKYCESLMDFCENDTCLNNGTCLSTPDGPTCTCPSGFSGLRCEIDIDDCKKGYCHNNGKCVDLINDYKCDCPEGFSGPNCEINIYDCASDPCLNRGTCFDKINGYRCCCPPNYFGTNCENKLDPCVNMNCKNEGICVSNDTLSQCVCKPGFGGDDCEINIDDCSSQKCFNNGLCIVGIDSATCECSRKFSGNYCEEVVSSEYFIRFKTPVTSNYVELQNSLLLYGITVSFYMRTSYKDDSRQPTVLSYSYYDEANKKVVENALTLFNTNKLVLYLHGQMLHTGYVANSDSNWHHYAVTWDRNEGKWSFFVDGQSIVNGKEIGKNEYIWPGIFIIGQEQDSLGGSFSSAEAFAGDITELNVWDYAMSRDDIISSLSSCGKVGNLIAWYRIQRHVHGSVSVLTDVDLCKDIGTCHDGNCYCFHSDEDSADICKHSVEECSPDICQNGQPCTRSGSSLYCNCSAGYDGRFCEHDLNECMTSNGGCSHQCINTIGSYECKCPDGMHLSNDALTCKENGFCEVENQIYLDGESWFSDCQKCVCEHGNVICAESKCKKIKCLPKENLVIFPGDCCPRCQSYSFCLVSANKTLSTSSNSRIEFSKEHDFTLVEDCSTGLFSIRLESIQLQKNLLIYQNCSKIRVFSSGELVLNDNTVHLPFENDIFKIERSDESVDIWSQSGLYVEWSVNGDILVALPSERAKYACGICSSIQEYNMMKNSELMDSEASQPLVRKFLEGMPSAA